MMRRRRATDSRFVPLHLGCRISTRPCLERVRQRHYYHGWPAIPGSNESSMATNPRIYIGGKLYDKQDAKITVYAPGLLYGDGVFEGIRIYSGKVFRLAEHVDRLYESARHIHLEIPMTRAQMAEAIESTVKANDKREG